MTSMLATEAAEKPAARTLLETWGKNERMRHVPPVEWIVRKLDGDLRRRIDIACAVFAVMSFDDARKPRMESELRALSRAIDRLADSGRHIRTIDQRPSSDVGSRISSAIAHAVTNLNSLDANLFGRRYPFQTFERSRAEAVAAALMVVTCAVTRTLAVARDIDPSIDERLLAGLVTLQEPLREQPIA
jgi:hypothetical protein